MSRKGDYLSKRQIEVILKTYYMKTRVQVAESENIPVSRVMTLLEKSFRILRMAYAPQYRKGCYFDAKTVLSNMAESAGLEYKELYDTLQGFIAEGILSENRDFWLHITYDESATPIDLLNFLFAKFEKDIVPMHTWDLFGREK